MDRRLKRVVINSGYVFEKTGVKTCVDDAVKAVGNISSVSYTVAVATGNGNGNGNEQHGNRFWSSKLSYCCCRPKFSYTQIDETLSRFEST